MWSSKKATIEQCPWIFTYTKIQYSVDTKPAEEEINKQLRRITKLGDLLLQTMPLNKIKRCAVWGVEGMHGSSVVGDCPR